MQAFEPGQVWVSEFVKLMIKTVENLPTGQRIAYVLASGDANDGAEDAMHESDFRAWIRIVGARLTPSLAKQLAIKRLETILRAVFPYTDPKDDPDKARGQEQVLAYGAFDVLKDS